MKDYEIENAIRDHLSGTPRNISKANAHQLIAPQASAKQFHQVWQGLIDEAYLLPVGDSGLYCWETLPGLDQSRSVVSSATKVSDQTPGLG